MTLPYFFPYDNRIETKHGRVGAILRAVRGFLLSPAFMMLSASVAAVTAALGEEHTMTGLVINAQLFALALFLCDDFAAAMTPFLTVMCQGATLFNEWEIILSYIIPWGIPAAAALVFHLTVYRKPLRNGITLPGLVAAGTAILLGGLFADNLASPLANATGSFYYFGLSFGLVLLYLLFSSHYKRLKDYDPYELFLWQMLFTGLLCTFIFFLALTRYAGEGFDVIDFRNTVTFRNSLANIMIMGLPAPFYFAGKRTLPLPGKLLSFALGLIVYLALFLTTSRTAMIFGSLLLFLCLIYYFKSHAGVLAKCLSGAILLGAVALLLSFLPILLPIFDTDLLELLIEKLTEISFDSDTTEPRMVLFARAMKDFFAHPLFGVGILSQNNVGLYAEFSGCIIWYHMYFPQIFGSMGLFGTAAYTLLLGTRARLMFFRPDHRSIAVSLTALSLFLYSMTDPGEFMPIPFGMMAVLCFVLLERHAEAHPENLKMLKKTQKTIDKTQKI